MGSVSQTGLSIRSRFGATIATHHAPRARGSRVYLRRAPRCSHRIPSNSAAVLRGFRRTCAIRPVDDRVATSAPMSHNHAVRRCRASVGLDGSGRKLHARCFQSSGLLTSHGCSARFASGRYPQKTLRAIRSSLSVAANGSFDAVLSATVKRRLPSRVLSARLL